MNTISKTLAALTAGIAMISTAHAASYGGVDFAFTPYVGAKTGAIMLDSDALDADPALALGVVAGYEIDQNFGTEFEYVTSAMVDTDYAGGEYDVSTMGAYATYRYDFPANSMYVKGKLGYAQSKFESDSGNVDDKSVAGGVSFGKHISPALSVEGEYSVLPSVADSIDTGSLTIGARMKF